MATPATTPTPSRPDPISRRAPGPRTGVRLTSGFGAGWVVGGCAAFDVPEVGLAVGIVLFVVVLVLSRRLPDEPSSARPARGPQYRTVVFAEAAAVAVAVLVCVVTSNASWLPAIVAIVVGLHFVVLASTFRQLAYVAVGILMVVLGVATFALAPAHDVRIALPCLGCAAILFGSAAWRLRGAR